jgi:hypothetical protein
MKHPVVFRLVAGLMIIAIYVVLMFYPVDQTVDQLTINPVDELVDIFLTMLCVVVLLISQVFPFIVGADRRRFEAYYEHLGKPTPAYSMRYYMGKWPHKSWKKVKGSQNWETMDLN